MLFRLLLLLLSLLILAHPCLADSPWGQKVPGSKLAQQLRPDPELEALLARMTWQEKCGQLTQYAGALTGPQPLKPELVERLRTGEVGSVLSISEVARCRQMQEEALKSRLGIPLLFAFDVIHGYRTVFPIPLAEAASWDPEMAREAARISAREASAAGINWTFAPMVDLARDPRWGRVIEGAGEDPYLGSRFAEARVSGFQDGDLSRPDTLAATAKHLGGYGAAEGGRDYDTAELSERTLREFYFPPFEAAMEAGVASVMPSFHETAGRPSHANSFLLQDVLRQEWGFPGLVVSDYGAVEELLKHRVVGTRENAGLLALKSGVEVDMMSDIYRTLNRTPETEALVDRAVLRTLTLKKALGLFEDPYRYLDLEREKQTILRPEFRKAARRAAARSAVLLENRAQLLPLNPERYKNIAVIGPLAADARSALGEWNLVGRVEDTVSPLVGLESHFTATGAQVRHLAGCPSWEKDSSQIAEAVRLASESDLVVLVLGEPYEATGESRNRTDIGLPGSQLELARAIAESGTPVVTVLANGRPLTLGELAEVSPTLLVLWHAGCEAGNGLWDVLVGIEPIGGKLPMSFPRRVGQIPVYYNRKTTGRPPVKGQDKYRLDYYDSHLSPQYSFGYGLTTSNFSLGPPSVVSALGQWPLTLEVELVNTGPRKADEVVQLYVSDEVRSVTPPVKELKGFQRVTLKPGEKRRLLFTIEPTQVSFVDLEMKRRFEPGWFSIAIGASSDTAPQLRVKLDQSGLVESAELAG